MVAKGGGAGDKESETYFWVKLKDLVHTGLFQLHWPENSKGLQSVHRP